MYHRLLLMSLLSLLFGCGKYPRSKEKYPGMPHFPQTDNPAFRVEPVAVDSGFVAQSFVLAPDGESVFVLAYDLAGTAEHMPYLLLQYDTSGRFKRRLAMPIGVWEERPVLFWGALGQLYVGLFHSTVSMIDPLELRPMYEYHAVHSGNFLPRKKLDQMTFDEQRDAYAEALRHAPDNSGSGDLLQPPKGAVCCLALTFKGKPDEAWHIPQGEEQDFIDEFGLVEIPQNPFAHWGVDEKSIEVDSSVTNGDARLRYADRDVFDYRIRYPNIKGVESRIFELKKGGKTARFKLSNLEKHSLYLQIGDNGNFLSDNGSIWLIYENQLYRITN